MSPPGGPRLLPWTLAAAGGAIALFLSLGAAGWPGFTPNGCRVEPRPTCFCERPHPGLVAQPANTWSNLGFVAVGLTIAAAADRGRLRARPANPLTRTRFYPGIFAVTIALLGPGSMFLHGSLTREGGALDVASMYLFAGLLLAYASLRLLRLSRRSFAGVFALGAGVPIALRLTMAPPVEVVFGLLLVAFAAAEWAVARRRPELARDPRPIALATGLFAAAFAVWVPSLSGGPLCDPESPLQGHALWHLLCAASAGCVFLYLASERAVTANGRSAPSEPDAPRLG